MKVSPPDAPHTQGDVDASVAVVSVEPAGGAVPRFTVRVARGSHLSKLDTGTNYGPYPEDDVSAATSALLETLRDEGFTETLDIDLILALSSDSAQQRGRAAVRLGWRRPPAALGALLRAAQDTKRPDHAVIVDALGLYGDPVAIPLARELASKQQLARRRSGAEALRNLGDEEGLAGALVASLARLPDTVAAVLSDVDESVVTPETVQRVLQAVDNPNKVGLVADLMYERGSPLGRAVALRIAATADLGAQHVWRYIKSLFKRTLLRDDPIAFARVAHAIERASQSSTGCYATVKSGLHGKPHPTRIFGPKTQRYVLRAAWRHLRRLARYRPDAYVRAAATLLVAYGPADERRRRGHADDAGAFLFHRILHARDERWSVRWHTLLHVLEPGGHEHVDAAADVPARREAFPALWDAAPESFVRLLLRAAWPDVVDFAAHGLARHPAVLRELDAPTVVEIVERRHRAVSDVALEVLAARWSDALAAGPAWEVLAAVHERPGPLSPALEALGAAWLEQSHSQWVTDPDACLRWLSGTSPLARHAADVAVRAWSKSDVATRRPIATAVVSVLATAASTVPDGDADALTTLGAAALGGLRAELDEQLDTTTLVAWLASGVQTVRTTAARLLADRPAAVQTLGVRRIGDLAGESHVLLRRCAHALLRAARSEFASDPSVLVELTESSWVDTQDCAFELLGSFDVEVLGLDGVIGLCDSINPRTQAAARALVEQHFASLPTEALLFRLAEHPSAPMRRFAFELIEGHLRAGAVPLMRIEGFVRACLMDPAPDRELKRRLIAFLATRGEADEGQAEVVAKLLARSLRTRTDYDFQRITHALAKLSDRYPLVTTDLVLQGEATA
ncbi:MAG: hypothetical protein R3B40_20025 [Polyangiales bacterium]